MHRVANHKDVDGCGLLRAPRRGTSRLFSFPIITIFITHINSIDLYPNDDNYIWSKFRKSCFLETFCFIQNYSCNFIHLHIRTEMNLYRNILRGYTSVILSKNQFLFCIFQSLYLLEYHIKISRSGLKWF